MIEYFGRMSGGDQRTEATGPQSIDRGLPKICLYDTGQSRKRGVAGPDRFARSVLLYVIHHEVLIQIGRNSHDWYSRGEGLIDRGAAAVADDEVCSLAASRPGRYGAIHVLSGRSSGDRLPAVETRAPMPRHRNAPNDSRQELGPARRCQG